MDEQARASLMRDGIAAAQHGQREQAYRLFSQLTEDDYNNASAWVWLSATSDDPDESLAAARNALALEPNNEFAQQAERLALQAQEERGQNTLEATQQAEVANAAASDAAVDATLPVAAQAAASQADRSLIPPFLTQEMATQNPPANVETGPVTTRPARSFTSRLEERTAVRADQREIEAARRKQTWTTAAIVLAALLVVGLIIYGLYNLISSQGNSTLTAQAEPTATPSPSPTNIPAILRVTATVLAQENANATATADVLAVTATAQAQSQANAQQTFTAQTFPTATPGPAALAYNIGLDAYNRQQYPQAATALAQAVQLDRHSVLANYYLGLTDLQLATASAGSGTTGVVVTSTVAAASPISGTTTPTTGTITPAAGTPTPTTGTPAPTAATTSSASYFDQATSDFRNVIALAPNWAGGYAGLADTYLRQGRYTDALTFAKQAVNLDNGRPEYFLLLGRIYDGLGNPSEARKAYDAAAGLAPPIPGATPFPTPTNAPPVPTSPPASPTATTAPGTATATGAAIPPPIASTAPQPPTATAQSAPGQEAAAPTPTAALVVTVVVP